MFVAHHVNAQQEEVTGDDSNSDEEDSGNNLEEDERILSDDDDSFAERLENTINDGVEDVREGKAIVGGGKRNNEETRQANFADEDEFEGILAQCTPELVQAIFHYESRADRMMALNNILNRELAKLSPEQQASVRSQPTASLKFSLLREYVEANAQNKRSKKNERESADY